MTFFREFSARGALPFRHILLRLKLSQMSSYLRFIDVMFSWMWTSISALFKPVHGRSTLKCKRFVIIYVLFFE